MAIGVTSFPVLWATASTIAVSGSSDATSDSLAITATVFQAQVAVKADHSGTPGAADFLEAWLLPELGTFGFATTVHGQFIGLLDMNIEDPVTIVEPINMPVTNVKVYLLNNAAESVTGSALILGQTG